MVMAEIKSNNDQLISSLWSNLNLSLFGWGLLGGDWQVMSGGCWDDEVEDEGRQ